MEQNGILVPASSVASPTLLNVCEITDSEEVAFMMNQARLADLLKRATVRRCEGQSSIGDSSDGKYRTRGLPITTIRDYLPVDLQMHEERFVTKLTGVTILPRQGETGIGTLEAHVNGFIYSTWGFRKVFMHADIEEYFLRLGKQKRTPLLQFHLQHPIKMGSEETKDVQFCLVPTFLGKVRSEDSDNIRKDKQTRFSSSRNEDLMNFVQKVQETQWTCRSQLSSTLVTFQVLEEFEVYAAFPMGTSAIFSLTDSALVVLGKTPYVVVRLYKIQIVNPAHCEADTFDMTVVFKDLERDVLQFRSIPLKFLAGIKRRLSYGHVKYYVNNLRPNWMELVRDIRERPKWFLEKGGWC